MAVLVTRPAPDNDATADALRGRAFEPLLAPMLTFRALRFQIEEGREFRGLILTSANAMRALAASPQLARVQGLPVFAVGERTTRAVEVVVVTGLGAFDTVEVRSSSLLVPTISFQIT